MMVSLQSSLGIQFGKDYLLLVHLKKFLKEVALDCHELIHLPSDLSEEELEEFCSREISRSLKKNAIGKENVWVGLPRSEFLLRFITLPLSAEENLQEVIRYEMGKYIPFSEGDVHFDFVIIERNGETRKLRVLLLLMQKKVLEKHLSILRRVGITPLGIEMSANSLLNLFLLGKNSGEHNTPIALVDARKHGFELSWISNGSLKYSRAMDFSGEAKTDQVQQIREELRNGYREAFPSTALRSEEKKVSPIVFLTGDGITDSLFDDVDKTKELRIQMLPTEIIAFRLNFSEPFPQSLTSGIGLALRGMKRVPWDSNFLPQTLRKKTSKIGLYLSFILFITVLVFSVGWGASTIIKDRLQLRTTEKEVAALKNEVFAIQNIQQETQNLTEKIEALERIKESEFSKLEILKELSNLFPSSVWLTDFRYYKGELQLSGYAASASDLIAILDGSALFSSSEFTAPITRDRGGQESFKIKTSIEGG